MQEKDITYELMAEQLKSLFTGETDLIANLANASAVLFETLSDLNWAGFYLMKGKELVLGPFQGKAACIRIPVGKGVCGTAVQQDAIQLVADVHQFPGHIACDSASNSEIVLPLHHNGQVVGVLDIDSPLLGRFDRQDEAGLKKCAEIIEAACDWSYML